MFQLDKGILLEDKNVLLEWGRSFETLAIDNGGELTKHADRTIIEWGTHSILGGLKLDLTNVYLLSNFSFLSHKFTSIAHQTNGDKQSFENFDLISNHLIKLFGEPSERNGNIETDREKCWVWQTRDAKLTLYLFEQHAFKLHFTITQV